MIHPPAAAFYLTQMRGLDAHRRGQLLGVAPARGAQVKLAEKSFGIDGVEGHGSLVVPVDPIRFGRRGVVNDPNESQEIGHS